MVGSRAGTATHVSNKVNRELFIVRDKTPVVHETHCPGIVNMYTSVPFNIVIEFLEMNSSRVGMLIVFSIMRNVDCYNFCN